MAKLASIASGNFTSSSTWGVIEETSFRGGVSNFGWLIPTNGVLTSTGNFTPTATTNVTHVAFRLVGTGSGGVLECDILNVTANTTVAGSFFSMNKSTLQYIQGSMSASWFMLKLPSTVTLTSGISYAIRFRSTVSATNIQTTSGGNTATLAMRFLVTSTNQAPAAGDDLWVCAEYTTASTVNQFTVTMDNTTSATTFGSGIAGYGGINLNQDAFLRYQTSASTNYYLRLNGNLWLNAGATFSMGTSANTIPSTSTAVLEFSGASQGIQTNGTAGPTNFSNYVYVFDCAGNNPTNPYALLGADAAVAATSITTNISTGWKSGDQVVLAGTGAVATGQDLRTLSTDAVGTTLTVTSGLTNAHGGSGDIVAEVINLTRNVVIRNSNATTGVFNLSNSLMDIEGTEIRNMGIFTVSGAGQKTFKYSSFYNSAYMAAAVTGVMNFEYNCFYNCQYFLIGAAGSTTSPSTINFNYFILGTQGSVSTGTSILINPKFTDFIGNRASGLNGTVGATVGTGSLIFYTALSTYTDRIMSGVISANTLHSSVAGVGATNVSVLNIYSMDVWRISATYPGFLITSADGVKVFNSNFYGNASTSGSLSVGTSYGSEIINCNFRAGTTITSSRGANIAGQTDLIFRNCTFGTGQTHSTADVQIGGARDNTILLENCLLNSTTKFSSLTNLFGNSFVKLQRYQQTNNNHYIYTTIGNAAQYDGVIYKTGTASTRLIPLTTTFKHKSPVKIIPVASGTSPTVSVWVRKSTVSDASGANYNGAQPRLILAYSPSVFNYTGQTDQVLATASAALGTWEQLTATIPYTAIGNAGFEIYVDCDGTAGWINVDDWSVS